MATPQFLAALKSSIEKDPVDYGGIQVTPDNPAMPAPIAAPVNIPSNDPLARLEGDPNGKIAPLTQGQALGINNSAIAPPQPAPVSTGKMVPVFNSAGQQIGEKPETQSAPLFKSPISHAPVTFDATAGKPVGPTPEAKPEAKVDPASLATGKKPENQSTGDEPLLRLPTANSGGAPVAFKPDQGIEEAFRAKGDALVHGANAEMMGIQNEAAGHGQVAGELENQRKAQETRAHDVDESARSQQEQIDHQSKLVADMKVDPGRFWAKQSTGFKIANVIAAGLAGFAQGLNHTNSNMAIDQVNRMQDQDIQSQRDDIEQGRGRLQDMKGNLAEFYKRTGNMDQATALANAKAIDARIEQTAAYAAGSQNEKVKAGADSQIADLRMQHAQWLANARAAQAKANAGGNSMSKEMREDFNNALAKGMNGEQAYGAAVAAQLVKQGRNPGAIQGYGGKAAQENTVNLPGGGVGTAITKEGADDYRQRALGADKFQRAINKMQEIRTRFGGGAFSPTAKAEYESQAAEAKTAYVQMNGFKRTPNETEFHALDKIVPPEISSWGVKNISTDEVLAEANKLADDARADAAGTYLVQDPNNPVGKKPPSRGFIPEK